MPASTTRTSRKRADTIADPFAQPPAQAELTPTNPEAKPEKLLKVYDPIEAGLKLMLQKHGGVLTAPPIVTSENVDAVKAQHKEMVTFRTTLEATRKAEKEESLRYGQMVDAEAKRIQLQATPIELAYKSALDKWETAEEERRMGILRRISELRNTGQQAIGKTAAQLQEILDGITTFPLAELQEFREQGATAQEAARSQVARLLQQAKETEAAAITLEIRRRIDGLRSAATQARTARTAAALARMIVHFEKLDPEHAPDTWGELKAEAVQTFADELAGLRQLQEDKAKAEKQEADNLALRKQLEEANAKIAAAAPPPTPAPTPAPTSAPAATSTVQAFGGRSYGGGGGSFTNYGMAGRSAADIGRQVAGMAPAPAPTEAPVVAADRLPQEGGLFKAVGMGIDSDGDMTAELVPAMADEPGAMRVLPGDGNTVEVVGMATPSELGMMPAPPSGEDIVNHLADHFDDHPLNVIGYLEAFDYAALRVQFTQPATTEETPQ